MGESASFDISKIFTLKAQKTEQGSSVTGIDESSFYASMQSVFAKANVDFTTAFDDLDADGDKVLTAEELGALNQYLDKSMMEELEEASAGSDLEGIMNGNQSMETKLTQIKALDLKGADLKALEAGDLKDLLNIISGAYANNPEDIKGDVLFNAIANNVPKEMLNEVINGNNSGYWLSKYGADVMTSSLKLDETSEDEDEKDKMGDLTASMDFGSME